MLIGEPPRTQYDLNFSIAGVPVRIHPFFWLVTLVLGSGGGIQPATLLIWVAVVFVSIMVHEFGHAIAMRYYGGQPAVTLYALGGLATYDTGFSSSFGSYRRAMHSTQAQVAIAAAGPLAGFLFAGAVVVGILLSGRSIELSIEPLEVQIGRGPEIPSLIASEPATQGFASTYRINPMYFLISNLLFVNIVWGLINLCPVYPLDGGLISRELFLVANPSDGVRQSLVVSLVAGAGLALFGLLQWHSFFMAILFGYLAYNSYMLLQQYAGPGGFGRGTRPW